MGLARIRKGLVRRVYETDAKGLYDKELIDEVGCGLPARCESFITANRARAGPAGSRGQAVWEY